MLERFQRPSVSIGIVRAQSGQQFEHLLLNGCVIGVQCGAQFVHILAILHHAVEFDALGVHDGGAGGGGVAVVEIVVCVSDFRCDYHFGISVLCECFFGVMGGYICEEMEKTKICCV